MPALAVERRQLTGERLADMDRAVVTDGQPERSDEAVEHRITQRGHARQYHHRRDHGERQRDC
ncbi:MAG: hypothetical protein KY458_13510 [Actinobacteria bacterium]|nr:hypothetical protein [Actinomycetota bacterium]